ncbi:SafA/ExsA family spore coat assembly protein [Bacillus solimangrovi]|uniref:LysM domain-containing protein n=1 Tax=Bacillus solimangrovi TaxID=1305675 RepID=A0A1E5LIM8_9BACI|nr:SafA/ExsA family spore coat assembly protein [Bacillus solimangrovi]OEH93921.1 hypothetical protein BFG57_10650 [Bacillus solimangrovi]
MRKWWFFLWSGLLFSTSIFVGGQPVLAKSTTVHIVQPGDTLWIISNRYDVSLSEVIQTNQQFSNPNLIYPGDKVYVPISNEAIKTLEKQVIQLTNEERAKHGLNPLVEHVELSRVARYKSRDMRDNNYFSNESPKFGSSLEMISHFHINYSYAGENIAAGQPVVRGVVKAWMDSPKHRKYILDPEMTHIGVGYAEGGMYGNYWTQLFIQE